MKKKHKHIPTFTSLEEEAKFWDTHSISDYWDEMSDVKAVVEIDEPRSETLILRVQKDMKDKMKQLARSKGLNVSTLARMWLMERLKTV